MIKQSIFLKSILTLVLNSFLICQPINEWSRIINFGFTDPSSTPYSMCKSKNDEVIIAGFWGGTLAYLIKLNSLGHSQLLKQIPISGYSNQKLKIANYLDGFILIAGTKILRLDGLGNTIWIRDLGMTAHTFIIKTNNDIVAAGYNGSYIYSNFLSKYDSLGNLLNSTQINVGDKGDVPYNLISTSDGGYLLVGTSYEPYIIKVDEEFNSIWRKDYQFDYGSGFHSAVETKGKSYLVVGNIGPNINGYGSDLLLKIDSTGAVIWSKNLGGSYANQIIETIDNNFLICGGKTAFWYNSWVTKIDTSGEKIWEYSDSLENPMGPPDYTFATDIIEMDSSTCIFTGYTNFRNYDIREILACKLKYFPKIKISTNTLDFGNVLVGDNHVKAVTIENEGSDVLKIISINNQDSIFNTLSSELLILPNDSSKIQIVFSPAASNNYYQVIALDHNASGSPSEISLSGMGFTFPSSITLSDTINFGNISSISNYRVVGLPGMTNSSVAQSLTGEHPYDWNAYWDSGAESNYQVQYNGTSTFNFTPGKAFWILSKNPFTVNQQVNAVQLSADYSYSIPLHSGWNLISNPFERSVLWSVVQTANSLIQNQVIYLWNGFWSNPTEFKPYEGYYFNNTGNLTSLKIPYNPGGSLGKTSLGKEALYNELPVDVSDMLSITAENSEVFIGINPESEEGIDQYDYYSAPGDFEKIKLSLVRNELPLRERYLFIEQRPEIGEGQEYDLEVKAIENEKIKLTAGGINNIADYEIYLLDTRLDNLYNLKEKNETEIRFAHQFNSMKLIIGTEAYIEKLKTTLNPVSFELYQNYPNAFNPVTVIRFSVPERTNVKLEIYTVLGELVKTLIDNVYYDGGRYEIEFDGRGLSSGVYIYRLQAGSFVSSKKMLLLK